jgi:alkaline phosphatase D
MRLKPADFHFGSRAKEGLLMPCGQDQRRQVLRLAAACAGALWLQRSAGGQMPKFDRNPFTLGVASGSPTHDSVVLWTRLHLGGLLGSALGNALTVGWELAHDEQFRRIAHRGQVQAVAPLGHSVHVEVQGLEPDRWYFYRFMAGEALSATGRTRTFPAPDAQVARLRLGYASCQRWEHGYFSAYRHMQKEDLDVLLFLGDYIYEYPGAANAVRPVTGGWALTLKDYRQRYALYKSDPDLQAMHAACPWLLTWDDHEVQNDYAGVHEGNSGNAPGGTVADFSARRAGAYQAYYEHMPLRASVLTQGLAGLAHGAEMRIYRQQRYGQLANILMLDNRQYRDAQACTPDARSGSATIDPARCAQWQDARRTLLGAAQERWLEQQLAHSGAPGQWTVLGQQTLFGQRDFRPGPEQFFWNDGWDGYPAARQRLTDALHRHQAPNPVLLGGDVHENWVGHVLADYADRSSARVGVEFCGTSISARSNGAGPAKREAWLKENPHFVFADTQAKGYGVAEFTPSQLTTTLRVLDDVTHPDASISTLATFTVQAGRSQVDRV